MLTGEAGQLCSLSVADATKSMSSILAQTFRTSVHACLLIPSMTGSPPRASAANFKYSSITRQLARLHVELLQLVSVGPQMGPHVHGPPCYLCRQSSCIRHLAGQATSAASALPFPAGSARMSLHGVSVQPGMTSRSLFSCIGVLAASWTQQVRQPCKGLAHDVCQLVMPPQCRRMAVDGVSSLSCDMFAVIPQHGLHMTCTCAHYCRAWLQHLGACAAAQWQQALQLWQLDSSERCLYCPMPACSNNPCIMCDPAASACCGCNPAAD